MGQPHSTSTRVLVSGRSEGIVSSNVSCQLCPRTCHWVGDRPAMAYREVCKADELCIAAGCEVAFVVGLSSMSDETTKVCAEQRRTGLRASHGIN